MVERRKPIAVAEAVRHVMKFAKEGALEWVRLEDSYGRLLAQDLVADHDVPPFDRSPYDGFAIRSEDTVHANLENPVEFEVAGQIGAGSVFTETVGPFQAVRIMTGAQIPGGCDAVVMLEITTEEERDGKHYMSLKRSVKCGENLSLKGEDVKEGESLVPKGTMINPGTMALLATFGYSHVPVAKKPVIGVLATGTELLEVHEPLEPGKIRNSNAYMIASQIIRAGATPKYIGKVTDDFEKSFASVEEALGDVDMLITTGGVSVGDYDYLPAIYKQLGANVLFNKVAMRPGSVTTVAELNGKLLFGLSGNPSACYVGFELFVRPIVRTFLFSSKPHLQMVEAVLGADFPKPNPFTRFVRSKLSYDNARLFVAPSGLDKSNVVSSLADANALMVLPGGTRGFEKGMKVQALLLDDQLGCEWPWGESPLSSKL
ncbi:gephyrin-like molybdotransferase Glp [Bacillus songklensis]|uniref:Molybdopterin molybdenumtransferase n=1 Tax=Bacillus songklensis TaxID=1069116 RepID=A0ABV8AY30_9BACI